MLVATHRRVWRDGGQGEYAGPGERRHPRAAPFALGFDSTRLARVVAYLRAEVDSGAFPGAVLAVGRARPGRTARAVGHYGVDDPRLVEIGTLYDPPSLTKVVASRRLHVALDSGQLGSMHRSPATCPRSGAEP